jgi:hypothetical protein
MEENALYVQRDIRYVASGSDCILEIKYAHSLWHTDARHSLTMTLKMFWTGYK